MPHSPASRRRAARRLAARRLASPRSASLWSAAAKARWTLRTAAAAAALAMPLAGLTATPAHAATSCVVNGRQVTGPAIVGTPGDDVITCSSVDDGDLVDALAGDDAIALTGPVAGGVRGGDGEDAVTLTPTGSVEARGSLDGQFHDDRFALDGPVLGRVTGGRHDDRVDLLDHALVAEGADVRGARGADTLVLDAAAGVFGSVEGGEAADRIEVGGLLQPSGRVRGGDGDDDLFVGINQGAVDGGPGVDACRVVMGLPRVPGTCERE
ncbi:hypothetical protein [Streptomyces sp. SAJ15]|uniref:hypothetical protein n=1 Tax=Streptomyces sp. SAJ15 TaxID=2011095 RepID=UPI0011871CE6|nr:hypothetical protein [Streptomyces sp. SAJ15]TVL93548.1 hypothetical protein CD790_00275 [Streptomyces sp. SAJ15]